MEFSYAGSNHLPLKNFRHLVQEQFQDTQSAWASVSYGYERLINEPLDCGLKYYDGIMQALLSLKDIIQHFSSLFYRTSAMPDAIYARRHSMLKALRGIDEQAGELTFQILVLKNVSPPSSHRVMAQQRVLQQDLEKLLDDSNETIGNMRALLDRVGFWEKTYGA